MLLLIPENFSVPIVPDASSRVADSSTFENSSSGDFYAPLISDASEYIGSTFFYF